MSAKFSQPDPFAVIEHPVGVSVLLVILGLCLTFVARLPIVVNSPIEAKLQKLERTSDLSIDYRALRPTGLTGIALTDVEVEKKYEWGTARVQIGELGLYPELESTRNPFELSLSHIDFRRTDVNLNLGSSPDLSNKNKSSDSKQAPKSPERIRTQGPRQMNSAIASDLDVVCRECTFRLDGTDLGSFGRLEVENVTDLWNGLDVRGYGHLPGDSSFSISTIRRDRGEYQLQVDDRIDLTPIIQSLASAGIPSIPLVAGSESRNTAAVKIQSMLAGFESNAAAEAQISSIDVCMKCGDRPEIQSSELNLYLGERRLRSEDLTLRDEKTQLELEVDRLDVFKGSLSKPALTYDQLGLYLNRESNRPQAVSVLIVQKPDVEKRENPISGNLEEKKFSELPSNSAKLEFQPGDERDLDIRFAATDFVLEPYWSALGLDYLLRDGEVTGRQKLHLDTDSLLLTGTASLAIDKLEFRLPFISSEWLRLTNEAGWSSEVVADLRNAALSLPEGSFELSDTDVADYTANFLRVEDEVVADLSLETHTIDPGLLEESLPEEFTSVLGGTNLDGNVGFESTFYVHTGFPEGLRFEFEPFGKLDAQSPSLAASKIESLRTSGPPSFEIPGLKEDSIDADSWVRLTEVSDTFEDAIIAGEDTKFRDHRGFAWKGLERAMIANIKQNEIARGGSSLTQQLAKNLFLSKRRNLGRKIKEAYYTWRLEEILSKDKILQLYLNIANWGEGIRGIREAASYYYDKKPSELTWFESISLVSILPAPDHFGKYLKKRRLPPSRLEKMEHILKNLHFMEEISTERYHELLRRTRQLRRKLWN